MIVFVLLAGLASSYTPDQQTALDVINLSFQLGIAYEKASQGQNVAEFNNLVDVYNVWIQQLFGDDATLLLKTKINYTQPLAVSPETNAVTSPAKEESLGTYVPQTELKEFESDSDLSKFGKPVVRRRA
jgi:hypothetical protein